MTKAELNLAIAKLVYPDAEVKGKGKLVLEFYEDGWEGPWSVKPVPNYCNNWNDLMPLVVEYGIDFCYSNVSDKWYATDGNGYARHINPQRALAECLLKVLQEEDND